MLPILYNIPRDKRDWDIWSLSHQASHTKIAQKIISIGGPSLTVYQLDPMNLSDFSSFLNRNQQAHNDMLGVLGISGADLQQLDPRNDNQLRAWIALHAQEHRQAEQALSV